MAHAAKLVSRLHQRMVAAAGPLNWWPADATGPNRGRDEIIVGAVLTQNTAWSNVELALKNLKAAGMIALRDLAQTKPEAIAPLIRPSGYYNLKARRLHAVANFFAPRGRERWAELAAQADASLRDDLLKVYGIGHETADSILLYALERASFVIDAYTLRIGSRHGLFNPATKYEQARAHFMLHAMPERAYYNEYHALLVWIGNRFCKPVPRCGGCPLAQRDCFSTQAAWRAAAKIKNGSMNQGVNP